MTPAARLSAAIDVLDSILAGDPAERVLTGWARGSRYAGSKDRAAVRDIVFDCLRNRRSLAHAAGTATGRALVLAHQSRSGEPVAELFSGARFAPEELTAAETARLTASQPDAPLPVSLDFPDFLLPELERSLGADLVPVMAAMQQRAPVDLRVNTLKISAAEAQQQLALDGITAEPHPLSPTALRIAGNPRKLAASKAYQTGLVELQDVSSQAVADFCAVRPGMRVLDYCAGGGGKTLALAAQMHGQGRLVAHDKNVQRMKSLHARAVRAGATPEIVTSDQLDGEFDLVLVDAPCTGTGAWRRNPDSKWRLTPATVIEVAALQREILTTASRFVAPQGRLVYATCSLLRCENRDVVGAFLAAEPGWQEQNSLTLTPLQGGDGFFACMLSRR